MYTVIGMPGNRTMRVLWMLEEQGQSYEFLMAGPNTPKVVKGNPGSKQEEAAAA